MSDVDYEDDDFEDDDYDDFYYIGDDVIDIAVCDLSLNTFSQKADPETG